jgi:hypothetical protein
MPLHLKQQNWRVEIRRAGDDRPLVYVSGLSEAEAIKIYPLLQAPGLDRGQYVRVIMAEDGWPLRTSEFKI